MSSRVYKILEVFGIELEYMVVDRKKLNIQPVADKLFKKAMGEVSNEVVRSRINWSNELVLHVVEFKNKNPESNLVDLVPLFQKEIKDANKYLEELDCQLLPGAMHPWMDPELETKLWPYENNEIYASYDRIFGCKGHGWSNLQSLHINISFADDQEFHKLHSAIRFILPLVPALSSSSPLYENKMQKNKSSRLQFYLQNQKRIPSIIGDAIPDVIKSQDEYHEKILSKIYQDIAPYDENAILQEEWLNSRGAIPKFERGCIEIRLADVQEAPMVDLAVADFWIKLIKKLSQQSWVTLDRLESLATLELKNILYDCVQDAENAVIKNKEYLSCFGVKQSVTAGELLRAVFERLDYSEQDLSFKETIDQILKQGSLSTRIIRKLEGKNFLEVYKELAECLNMGKFFEN